MIGGIGAAILAAFGGTRRFRAAMSWHSSCARRISGRERKRSAGSPAENPFRGLGIGRPLANNFSTDFGKPPVTDASRFFASARRPAFYAALPGQHHCPDGPEAATAYAAALIALGA